MTMAANLIEAAYLSFDQCFTYWDNDDLAAQVQLFCTTTSPLLPDEDPNSRTVGNWLVILQGISTNINTVAPYSDQPLSLALFYQVVFTIYRMCWAAEAAAANGKITVQTASDILSAWNTAFGTP